MKKILYCLFLLITTFSSFLSFSFASIKHDVLEKIVLLDLVERECVFQEGLGSQPTCRGVFGEISKAINHAIVSLDKKFLYNKNYNQVFSVIRPLLEMLQRKNTAITSNDNDEKKFTLQYIYYSLSSLLLQYKNNSGFLSLDHKACLPGVYNPRNDRYYADLGLSIPRDNTIDSYSIFRRDGTKATYTVGSGDIDRKNNCVKTYYTTGEQIEKYIPDSCKRRTWSYFSDHSYEILSCRDLSK